MSCQKSARFRYWVLVSCLFCFFVAVTGFFVGSGLLGVGGLLFLVVSLFVLGFVDGLNEKN
jgi:hypothetical protein